MKRACSISKDNEGFQLNCDIKYLSMTFNFRGLPMVWLEKLLASTKLTAKCYLPQHKGGNNKGVWLSLNT